MPKVNWAGTLERIDFVYQMMSTLATTPQICRAVAERYQVGERQAKQYMSLARDRLVQDGAKDRKERRLRMRAALEAAFRRAWQLRAMAACAKFLDMLCRLDGLYTPEQHEIVHAGTVTAIDVKDKRAVDQRIQELLERLRIPLPDNPGEEKIE